MKASAKEHPLFDLLGQNITASGTAVEGNPLATETGSPGARADALH